MKTLLVILMLSFSAHAEQVGVASHYSTRTGTKTASGEKLVDSKLTAAHRTLKFGTQVKVTDLKTNKSVVVKITDRGPYAKGRVIDLSQGAAKKLGILKRGIAKVKLEIIKPCNTKSSKPKAARPTAFQSMVSIFREKINATVSMMMKGLNLKKPSSKESCRTTETEKQPCGNCSTSSTKSPAKRKKIRAKRAVTT